MLLLTVPQLLQMGDGVAPEGIRGTLTQVYEHKTTQYGSLQGGTLKSDGQSIKIIFSGRPPVPQELVNQEVYITAEKNQKGMFGLKRKDNAYKGKVTPEVWVYAAANVAANSPQNGNGNGGYQQPQQQYQQQPQQQQSYQPQGQPYQQGPLESAHNADNMPMLKEQLMKRVNLYIMCYQAANYVRETLGSSFSDDQHQACVASLYIQMTGNRRDGFEDQMPAKKMDWSKQK